MDSGDGYERRTVESEEGFRHLDQIHPQGGADEAVAADLGVEGVGQGTSQRGEIEDDKGGEDQSVEK